VAGEQPIRVVKKVHGEHAHHGGAWKVAFADFMTAMMAFFLVMWILGLSESTRKAIAGYFNDPTGFAMGYENGKNPFATTSFPQGGQKQQNAMTLRSVDGATLRKERRKMESVKKEIDMMLAKLKLKSSLARQVEVRVTEEGLRIELVDKTDVGFFLVGSAILRPQAVDLVAQVAREVAKLPNEAIIEGHTDARQYAGKGYTNFELSADRAGAARRLFQTSGRPNQVSQVRGCADSKLRRPDDPLSYENRRITILVRFSDRALKDRPTKLEKEIAGKIQPDFELDSS